MIERNAQLAEGADLKTSDVVFVVGAGRSGTTWLQMMLGAHPSVATGQESQLFNNYLRKMYEQWARELKFPETDKVRKHGITSYIDETRFIELLRSFAVDVFGNVMNAKPGATLFLEKSPNNSFNIDLIFKCFPDARYIHLIRDGRDVVTSMLAAKSGWGKGWAPDNGFDGASEWVTAVSESQRLADMTNRYIEVRYESLLTDGPAELRSIFEFLGVTASDEEVNGIYDRFAFDKLKKNEYKRDVLLNPGVAKASGTGSRSEPKGFFRKGISGDWKESLSKVQIAEVYWAAGEMLQQLSYTTDYNAPSKPPSSIRRRNKVAAIKAFIKQAGGRLLS